MPTAASATFPTLLRNYPSSTASTATNGDSNLRQILYAYLTLQRASPSTWMLVWLLQGIRHLPAYLLPFLTGLLIDAIDPQHPERAMGILPRVLAAALVLCIGNVISTTLGRQILSRINRTMVAELRSALLQRLHGLSLRFHDHTQQGALQNKFLLDVGRLEALQGFLAEGLLMHGTAILVMLGIVAATNPLVLVVIATAVPVNLAVVRLLWRRIQGRSEEFRIAEGNFLAHLHEALAGIRTTRAHGTEAFMEQRVNHVAQRVVHHGMRLDTVQSLFGSLSWATASLLHMVVVALGVILCVSGTHHLHIAGTTLTMPPITLGQLTVMLSYYVLVASALGSIVNGLPTIAAAGDAITSLAECYRDREEDAAAGTRPLPQLAGHLHLENVYFRYREGSEPSLRGITMTIPAGTTVALVGASGSGKTTIANLVLGLYQPEGGRITIDGLDMATVDRRSYRQQVGVVSQSIVLFHGTVLENIAWGDTQPDPVRARIAARQAQALEFIEALPAGFDHLLGDGGNGLSGGQRQRLALARAFYRNPRILVLDEATSALDPTSEAFVQQSLDELLVGRTAIIIAHRLQTVRRADIILVLDHGRIVERGTYDELVRQGGYFHRLAQMRFR